MVCLNLPRLPLHASSVVFVIVFLAARASGEWAFDFGFGAGFTDSTDLDGKDTSDSIEIRNSARESFEDSFSLTLRPSYWVDRAPYIGLGMDLSFFAAEGEIVESNIVNSFSPLLMVRAPLLRSKDFPHGQVQPYAGIGPGFFLSFFESESVAKPGSEITDVDLTIGLDTRVGVAFLPAPEIAVFVEYRFSYFEPEYDDDDFILITDREDRIETEIATHHILFGVSFRIW